MAQHNDETDPGSATFPHHITPQAIAEPSGTVGHVASSPTGQTALVVQLTAAGLVPEAWAASLTAVDRALFVPHRCWVRDHTGQLRPLDRHSDIHEWESVVYSDTPIVTQLDNGTTAWPDTGRVATASALQPSVVLYMLDALDLHDGHTVLEIGAGTGYSTAMLAHRLGDDRVTSIDLDDETGDLADAALEAAGLRPETVWADGKEGWEPNAPYDRIISITSVLSGQFPVAWLRQCHINGEIVTSWKTVWGSRVLVKLDSHLGTATGRVIGDLRVRSTLGSRTHYGQAARFGELARHPANVARGTTTVPPHDVAIDPDGSFAVGLRTCGIQHSIARESQHDWELLVYDVDTESWVAVQVNEASSAAVRFDVRQHGSRSLWTEIEDAHAWWIASDKPARTRFGLTATATTQAAWLDHDRNVVTIFT